MSSLAFCSTTQDHVFSLCESYARFLSEETRHLTSLMLQITHCAGVGGGGGTAGLPNSKQGERRLGLLEERRWIWLLATFHESTS